MYKRDRAYLSVARYFAGKSTSRMKHGAVIVRGGNVLGTGCNKDINHPTIVSSEHIKTYCSRHAEIEAIRDAGYNVKGAVMYVARVNRSGMDRNSMPCKRCGEVIAELGIKRVVYTFSDLEGVQRFGIWRNNHTQVYLVSEMDNNVN